MNTRTKGLALFGILIATSGCERQSAGFALPPGDAKAGEATFVYLHCDECHSVKGAIKKRKESVYPELEIVLGGPVARVKTYGELVTSIIHPSERILGINDPARKLDEDTSIMPIYNQQMTVEQLVDLTTFLQESYDVVIPHRVPMYVPH